MVEESTRGPGEAEEPGEEEAAAPLVRELRIDPRNAGRRIDVWLAARFPSWSRTRVQRAIAEGLVQSDQRALKAASLLRAGELLLIRLPGLSPEGPPPPAPPLIYEDDLLLVFNKPAGLLVHPAGERFAWALIGLARSLRPGLRLDLVHRLDRDTSGVVVLTKDVASNAFLKRAIAQRRVEVDKQYLAIVRGQPIWESTRCDFPIGLTRDSLVRLRRGVREDEAGEQAITTFEVLQRMPAHALVRCELHTGRTHQIRVHLEALGHPILGDRLYGQPDEVFIRTLDLGLDAVVRRAVGFPRQALHCWKMQLPHPRGGLLQLEAPLPEDMARVVEGAPPRWPDPGAAPGEVLSEGAPPRASAAIRESWAFRTNAG